MKNTYLIICCLSVLLLWGACSLFEKDERQEFTTYLTTIGGNGFDLATDVIETDDAFVICGAVGPQCDIVDAMVAKIDKPTGSTIAMRTFGNPNQGFEENFFSLADVGDSYRAVGFSLKPLMPESDGSCSRDTLDLDGKISYLYIDKQFENSYFDTLEESNQDRWDAGFYVNDTPAGKVYISGSWRGRIAMVEIVGDENSVQVVNEIRNSTTYGDGRSFLNHSNGKTYLTGKWHSAETNWEYRAYLAEVDFQNNAFINEHFFEFLDRGEGGWVSSNVEAIVELPGGDIFMIGVLSNDLIDQGYLLKTDQSGNELFFDIPDLGDDSDLDELVLLDDGLIAAGKSFRSNSVKNTNSDILIAKFDFDGNLIWKSCIDFNENIDSAKSIKQTSDGGFVLVGRTTNEISGIATMILAKTDAEGKIEGLDCECN